MKITSEKIDPLQWIVEPCNRSEIREFIEKHHYSHNINGVRGDFFFKLIHEGEIVGAMLYGKPAMKGQWQPYGEKESDVIELRRLVLIDNTPRNMESYFIGKTLRWLRQNTTIKCVVSYADPEYGHEGVVYKASNFTLRGTTAPGKVINYKGKRYHDRSSRAKYGGKYKPFALELRNALRDGTATTSATKPKNIYTYQLKS